MFLSEKAKRMIEELRDSNNMCFSVNATKASICDIMNIVMIMYQDCADENMKGNLIEALNTLTYYSELITALSKEK